MAAASPALLAGGRVNVIGITEIRDQAGARWPRIRDSVHARLDGLLRSYLGVTDFFARIDETTYLVTMPSSEPEELSVVCLHALHDLHRDLLGRCELNCLQIARATPGEGGTVVLNPLPPEAIGALARRAGIPGLPEVAHSTGVAVPQAQPAQAPGAERARPAVKQVGDNIFVERHFIPIWNASRSAVLTYLCAPKSIVMNDRRLRREHVPPRERAELELACFDEGVEKLTALAARRIHFLLGVQISFEVLASPHGRKEILSLCRRISYEHRDYIDFILTEIPPGVAQTRLSNMITQLKPFGRRVSATVAPRARTFAAYNGIGIHAIGLDLQEYPRGDCSAEDDVARLAEVAKKARLRSFALSINDCRSLAMVHEAGIHYLCGDAVLPACREPVGVRRLSWEDLTDHSLVLN